MTEQNKGPVDKNYNTIGQKYIFYINKADVNIFLYLYYIYVMETDHQQSFHLLHCHILVG